MRTKEKSRGIITQQIWMTLSASLPRHSYPSKVSGLSQSTPLSSFSESISKPQKKPQIATNKRIKANFGGRYDEPFDEIVISPSGSPMCNFYIHFGIKVPPTPTSNKVSLDGLKGSCKTPLWTDILDIWVLYGPYATLRLFTYASTTGALVFIFQIQKSLNNKTKNLITLKWRTMYVTSMV